MSLKYQDESETGPVEQPHQAYQSPVPLYTSILITGIFAVFVAQLVTGIDFSAAAAGFDKQAFLHRHEYWRILTGATTHASLLHVGMNCYAFYSFGKIFETLANRAHLAIVFLLSAIGGGVLSLIFAPLVTSVGASGGIVGLIGYLLVYAFRRQQFISAEFRKSLLINIGFILVFGLALYNVIDNFGHIGGLLTGALYGLIQIPSDPHIDPREAGPATEIAGIGALGLYIAACIFSIVLILRVI
jgi:membrane associated rhomboid family serine protease